VRIPDYSNIQEYGGIAIVYLLIKHRVEDYSKWKPVFDENRLTREKLGSKGWQLFHSLDNPNEIVILLEWDTKEHATMFIESEDLKKTMQDAGVVTKPEVHFFEKIEDFSV
jgi:heme-degrading monooxygenase HmoA